jgi:tetratricopeptide (TPR) repeat protein
MTSSSLRLAALGVAFTCLAGSAAFGQAAQQARVLGTVHDEAGQPLEGVIVSLDPTPGSTGNHVTGKTNKKGAFFFGIVRPGEYHMAVEIPGKAIANLKARAVNLVRGKAEEWAIDGRPNPAAPPKLLFDDGFEVNAELTIGAAVAASAEGSAPPEASDAGVNEIVTQVQSGDCASAIPRLDAAIQAKPDRALVHYLRGFCLGTLQQDEDAQASVAKALELNPKFEGAALLRAQLLRRLERPAEAEPLFRQELETTQNPQLRTEALIGLGLTQEELKNDAGALESFQQAIVLTPSRPEPYLESAAIHARMGQPDKAKEVLDQAQKVGASSPEALLNVGIGYFNKKDYPKAGEMFRQVLDTPGVGNADLAMAHALNARLLLRDGKIDEAVAAMRKSLELDPKGPLAEETRETLKAMKK